MEELVFIKIDMTNSSSQIDLLLQLELDCLVELLDLVLDGLIASEDSRELAGLGQTRTKNTRDPLDH